MRRKYFHIQRDFAFFIRPVTEIATEIEPKQFQPDEF